MLALIGTRLNGVDTSSNAPLVVRQAQCHASFRNLAHVFGSPLMLQLEVQERCCCWTVNPKAPTVRDLPPPPPQLLLDLGIPTVNSSLSYVMQRPLRGTRLAVLRLSK